MVTTPIITFIADQNEPDLYNDVTDLPNPFTMNIPIGITNTHPSATLYFKVSIVSPPAAYSVSSTNLGSLAVGTSAIFTFTPVRALPTLTAGEYDETLTFRVDAYTDSGYSAAYANQTLSVTIHHFNHIDASWTIIAHDTWDNGTTEGWSTDGNYVEGGAYAFYADRNSAIGFLSSPYALHCSAPISGKGYKNYNTNGYTKARFVYHIREPAYQGYKATSNLMINYVVRKYLAYPLPDNQWCRLAFNMPIGASIEVAVSGTYNPTNDPMYYAPGVDEIWVIAK
jgi:hypothetical protein